MTVIEQCRTRVLQIPELRLESGAVLYEVDVAYETYGELDASGSNAVLVCHALTGDAQAANWWDGVLGPEQVLDTARYFLVCANVLGGCNGSTGPQSVNPASGKPYGSAFPTISIRDMVHVQHLLLQALGVRSLHLVIGGSMGGLQAIEWAVSYSSFVRHCIPIASAQQLSALAIAYNDTMRTAVTNDPAWSGGDYYGGTGPVQGLALARKIGMITYRSYELFADRFGRETARDECYQIESYLDHHGQKLVNRFDAGSYLCLLKAMDHHDIGRGRGGLQAALQRITAKLLWVGIDSDRLYPAVEQRACYEALRTAGVDCEYAEIRSVHGHDAFLIECQQTSQIVKRFLQQVEGSRDDN
ncbi:homoserine O-acetyltransferase MetX [Tumebacillus permanentifrigoris]|uniref:Homoserine O-acetyltransferase n=1 Tax=Tumebacillus permanentifrigoris TaxID=378543 RepID=A0A316DF98_9BACL|nr:homoserine O-acetyltransferase [Tumebacillus permanentifrigoris]PWK15869.1 homoserine O-acetyltransferase [Tumebacillus permanentifrigoris]